MMKTALVHEWLTTLTGSEEVLDCMYELFPAPIHVLVANQQNLKKSPFSGADIRTSFIQKLPFGIKQYRKFLPLFPFAVEQHDLSSYDVILSSSHSVAKGVVTRADQLHITYAHTPMRYAWDMYHQYLNDAGLTRGVKSTLARLFLHYLRLWDRSSAQNVNHFIANSHYVAARIRKIYRREAAVIYPPVDIDTFKFIDKKEDFYLAASRFVPYKRLDLIAAAFSRMPNKKLLIVGEGPEEKQIRKAAKSSNVEILPFPGKNKLAELMGQAKAFVFAACEDFGIVPVEAQACGTPVIAYGFGGSLETVKADKTGVFFMQQTIPHIIAAVQHFEEIHSTLHGEEMRLHAESFSRQRFLTEYQNFVTRAWQDFQKNGVQLRDNCHTFLSPNHPESEV